MSPSTANLNIARERVGNVDKVGFADVLRIIMEIVEMDADLNGVEAKTHVIEIIRILINETAEDDKDWLVEMVDSGIVSSMIDVIICASKGVLDLNNKKCPLRSLFKCKPR
tara:strand:+ start:23071 stop:23403 length:333 start_codon:yes stop_codon:yes gene_type:complete